MEAMEAETQAQDQGAKKNNTMIIIGVVVAVLLCLCIVCFVGMFLLGPAVGNVFSNVIENLVTPTP